MKYLYLIAYILTIVLANWLITTYGIVSVGFGFMAPAGVYAAGLSFTLRDLVQVHGGTRWAIAAILIGASFSYIISPTFAVASGVAFLCSEALDFMVYTPLRARSWTLAVAFSNVAGAIVDSMIFLWLAFGSLAFLEGQVIGKLWMTALVVAVIGMVRTHAVLRRDVPTSSLRQG